MDRFEEAKAKIKDAIDLVSLVERYLPLKRAGRNMVGLCPFHAEKSPSFTVSAATQHYKCFGCGKAGDVFSFLMEREGLDFRTAFENLAERAGVPIEGVLKGRAAGEGRNARTVVAQTLGAVNAFFQASLQSAAGDAARAYLETRGLLVAAEAFGLGFHPSPGELARFVRSRKLPLDVLQAAGLFGRDGVREPFAGRVTFPIVDEGGRIVGFGARVLAAGQEPKYLNSPESPYFNKRRLLFGLRQAKEAGVRRLIVVEGYTDVIACHLAGFHGAVATLGTSLTADHARLLLRWATDGAVLLFDGDRAGRQAAERALRELSNVELTVKIAFLPEGSDPADMLQLGAGTPVASEARQRMESLLAMAEDQVVSWFRLLRLRYDLHDVDGAAKAANECAALLSTVENPVRRDAMVRRMAPWFGGDESALRRLIKPRGAAAEGTGAGAGRQPAGAAPARPWRRKGQKDQRPEPLEDAAVARALAGGQLDRRAVSGGRAPLGAGSAAAQESPGPGDQRRPRAPGGGQPGIQPETQPDTQPDTQLGTPPDTQLGTPPGGPPRARPPHEGRSPSARPERRMADPTSAAADPAPADRALLDAELDLVACVLAQPDLHERLAQLEFKDGAAAEVADAVCASARDAALTMERLAQHTFTKIAAASPAAASLLAAAVERVRHIRDPEAAFVATDARRRQYMARLSARRLRVELEQARAVGDRSKVDELTRLFYAHFRQPQP